MHMYATIVILELYMPIYILHLPESKSKNR